MRLHHLHLPSPIAYAHSLRLQEALLSAQFAHKSLLRANPNHSTPAPNPTLLTFQTYPTYTVGRRHLTANPLSDAQIAFLTRGSSSERGDFHHDQQHHSANGGPELATFYASPRGGLLTYHAPGQLTAYLILNLRTHSLTPRCYIRMLEHTVIKTCATLGVPHTMTTQDPGVWIAHMTRDERTGQEVLTSTNRKLCAIGVQVSRGVTSHGIGLNVCDAAIETLPANAVPERTSLFTMPLPADYSSQSSSSPSPRPAPGYLSWGFGRIVACGLEGKTVTWLDRERAHHVRQTINMRTVADALAAHVAQSLNLAAQDTLHITEADI